MKCKLVMTGPGDRTITIVGTASTNKEGATPMMTVGIAIKNPSDKEDEELGITIATGRALRNPAFVVIAKAKRINKNMLDTFTEQCSTIFIDNFYSFMTFSEQKETTKYIEGISDPVLRARGLIHYDI